jgi:hypothetical protein
VHYPLNTVASAIADPKWREHVADLEAVRPGLTADWDKAMRTASSRRWRRTASTLKLDDRLVERLRSGRSPLSSSTVHDVLLVVP